LKTKVSGLGDGESAEAEISHNGGDRLFLIEQGLPFGNGNVVKLLVRER